DRAYTGIGPVVGVAQIAVVLRATPAKLFIDAGAGTGIVGIHAVGKGAFGNTDGPGQVRQGGGLDEVAGAHQMPVAKWPGTGQSQAIAPDETGIADQVRGNGGCPPVTPV